jgi:hypothetical protein
MGRTIDGKAIELRARAIEIACVEKQKKPPIGAIERAANDARNLRRS